ncbi:hypothetical protein T484DRAFT_1854987 [Baffinella frigidus]|nr:hypothetical protein T484DRAFT_1854987 [Cryptophyta sp. CCMP2293]
MRLLPALVLLPLASAFAPLSLLPTSRLPSSATSLRAPLSLRPAAFKAARSGLPLRPGAHRTGVASLAAASTAIYDEQEPEWLPMITPMAVDAEPGVNTTVMPLFPLGGSVYTPHTEPTLNIFEPRYRSMYNDILFSGARRFAVCSSNPEDGSFSKYAAVFYLSEQKEISEQTYAAVFYLSELKEVKFVCDHEITQRFRIDKILNPSAWIGASTYLKVEGEIVEDPAEEESDLEAGDAAFTEEYQDAAFTEEYQVLFLSVRVEEAFTEEYQNLMELQHELDEDVKFTKQSAENIQLKPGEPFWSTIAMWQVFQQQRVIARQQEKQSTDYSQVFQQQRVLARQQEMQKEFQEKLIAYLINESKGDKLPGMINISEKLIAYLIKEGKGDKLPDMINISDLPDVLKAEEGKGDKMPDMINISDLPGVLKAKVRDLQTRMDEDLSPLTDRDNYDIQLLMESLSHSDRMSMLTGMVAKERSRLQTKKSLKGLFASIETPESP